MANNKIVKKTKRSRKTKKNRNNLNLGLEYPLIGKVYNSSDIEYLPGGGWRIKSNKYESF